MINTLSLTNRKELRTWFECNYQTESACWLTITIKPQPNILFYLDVVEEALCFGWIDGVKKKNAEGQLMQRLSPRAKRSNWTELNKARVRRLEREGLMTDAGRRVLPAMNDFVIHPTISAALQADPLVYANFCQFPSLYQCIRVDTIQSYQHDQALFSKRLDKLIENTRLNKMYGQWNDDGRLN
ncbi:YdeI/OmpD-associated family protein [Brochothrix campestris]|uniref:Thymidylate synthase n=1 Tax=Brochothrix campestris FSL F6-1037 TaxID=1265861 RepID=W7D9K1_9LIST|nr:YdeI/OmpD-associated family protein [Brochothrix campestris]EUJ41933.1 hypothetical protein BCAMP_00920 [Brochothrix campestris FSL F6-1037]